MQRHYLHSERIEPLCRERYYPSLNLIISTSDQVANSCDRCIVPQKEQQPSNEYMCPIAVSLAVCTLHIQVQCQVIPIIFPCSMRSSLIVAFIGLIGLAHAAAAWNLRDIDLWSVAGTLLDIDDDIVQLAKDITTEVHEGSKQESAKYAEQQGLPADEVPDAPGGPPKSPKGLTDRLADDVPDAPGGPPKRPTGRTGIHADGIPDAPGGPPKPPPGRPEL